MATRSKQKVSDDVGASVSLRLRRMQGGESRDPPVTSTRATARSPRNVEPKSTLNARSMGEPQNPLIHVVGHLSERAHGDLVGRDVRPGPHKNGCPFTICAPSKSGLLGARVAQRWTRARVTEPRHWPQSQAAHRHEDPRADPKLLDMIASSEDGSRVDLNAGLENGKKEFVKKRARPWSMSCVLKLRGTKR